MKKSILLSHAKKIDEYLLVALSAALLFLGGRQAMSAYTLAPSLGTLDAIEVRSSSVDDAALDRLIENEESAIRYLDGARQWADLGMAYALKAASRKELDQDQVQNLQNVAGTALVKSLTEAPAEPHVWLRLAVLRQIQGAPASEVIADWRMSELTGPNENQLYLTRMLLALPLWNIMSAADRQALFHDIRFNWPQKQNELIGMAAEDPFAKAVIRSALLADLQKLKDFERGYAPLDHGHK